MSWPNIYSKLPSPLCILSQRLTQNTSIIWRSSGFKFHNLNDIHICAIGLYMCILWKKIDVFTLFLGSWGLGEESLVCLVEDSIIGSQLVKINCKAIFRWYCGKPRWWKLDWLIYWRFQMTQVFFATQHERI